MTIIPEKIINSKCSLFPVPWGLLQNRLTWDYVFPGQPAACSIELGYG